MDIASPARRHRLRHLLALAGSPAGLTAVGPVVGVLAGCAAPGGGSTTPPAGESVFKPVVIARDDAIHLPPGYVSFVLLPWGDPIGDARGMPSFRSDGGNTSNDQILQAGMNASGMAYLPLPQPESSGAAGATPSGQASGPSDQGLLVINYEYADHGLLFPDGGGDWTLPRVRKSQHAVGMAVVELRFASGRWTLQRPSVHARRLHANSPMRFSGPAAGHPVMVTSRGSNGRLGFGTFANAGCLRTPWGTVLSGEKEFNRGFRGRGQPTPREARYGISADSDACRWGEIDQRFRVEQAPNEVNHFGWMVEVDPFDPKWVPVKRTALGRFKHDGAASAIAADGRVAIYQGDGDAFEYLFKFMTRRPWSPIDRAANRDLLDDGALMVARLGAEGQGEWVELVQGRNGLTADNGFATQADVVMFARMAADRVGATRLDGIRSIAVDPNNGTVRVALVGGAARSGTSAQAANANPFGQLLRLVERGGAASMEFNWRLSARGGSESAGSRSDAWSSPDGLSYDPRGGLWLQTDIAPAQLLRGPFADFGNNQMLLLDASTRVASRFMTAPRGSRVCGASWTPDGTTLFVNIQHPGQADARGVDPAEPGALSNWPDGSPNRPRSATVVIRRNDGGLIGS